jgi:hypothetical protein
MGCGSESDKETGTTTASTMADVGISPQSGNWPLTTANWAEDDCNFEATLFPPTSMSFDDVTENAFSTTLFDQDGIKIGNEGACTYSGDDVYDCVGFTNSLTFYTSTLDITGTATVTMNSETSISGVAVMTADCTGSECGMMAAGTNSGSFPCTTNLNWTAAAP